MRIKQRPEDFSVKESYRYDEVEDGKFRVYLMDKQKLSTFDAVNRLRDAFGLRPGAISYCGLKDKQGRTEQLIAVEGADVDMQEPDLRLKYLGRTNKPLSARNITSNRFSVTVRGVSQDQLAPLNVAVAEVNRLGVVNYFDSQRFGSLKHGQGFIAKDIIRGDFEAALKNYLAKPSELDRSEDAKVKTFWRQHWGQWDKRVPFEGTKKYHRVLKSLREHPGDWVRAFMQIDSDYRAMQLFTYQSYLWNEAVRRYLQLLLPRESLFPMGYQAGTLLFHRDAPLEVLRDLRSRAFPLLGPESTFDDPKVEEATRWVLGKEKLELGQLRIQEAPRMLFFKHELRPLLVFPQKLVVGRPQMDELDRAALKVNIAFTLPPGAYATLVVKRLFHFAWREETAADIRATQDRYGAIAAARAAEAAGAAVEADDEGDEDTDEDWAEAAKFGDRATPADPRHARTFDRRTAARPAAAAAPAARGSERGTDRGARPADRGARPADRDARGPRTAPRRAPTGPATDGPFGMRTSAARPERPAPPRHQALATRGERHDDTEAEAPAAPQGFRARSKVRKDAKRAAQAVTAKSAKSQRKK